jgi:hypothetical protein
MAFLYLLRKPIAIGWRQFSNCERESLGARGTHDSACSAYARASHAPTANTNLAVLCGTSHQSAAIGADI